MQDIKKQLKELSLIKPRQQWVSENKERLLSQLSAQQTAQPQSVFKYWYLTKMLVPFRVLNFMAKPIGVITMLFVMILGSGAFTVSAAMDSMPGDILYPVKLTSERVQVSLTVSDEKKVQKQIDNAEERVNEIEHVVQNETDAVKKSEKIKVATEGLKKQLQEVNDNLDKAKETTSEKEKTQKTVELAKQVDQKTQEISIRLVEKKKEVAQDKEMAKSFTEAVNAIEETGVKAVEVIVQKYDNGEVEMTSQEVLQTVENKLKAAEDKLKEVSEQEKLIAEEDLEAQTEEQESVEEADDVEQTSDVDNEQEVDGEEVEEVVAVDSKTAEASLQEAKTLLDQGDMVSALEKVKESTTITTQVEAQVNERIEAVVIEQVTEVEAIEESSDEQESQEGDLDSDNVVEEIVDQEVSE